MKNEQQKIENAKEFVENNFPWWLAELLEEALVLRMLALNT
jgi:hypothetical protein